MISNSFLHCSFSSFNLPSSCIIYCERNIPEIKQRESSWEEGSDLPFAQPLLINSPSNQLLSFSHTFLRKRHSKLEKVLRNRLWSRSATQRCFQNLENLLDCLSEVKAYSNYLGSFLPSFETCLKQPSSWFYIKLTLEI